mgnify:FL=1|tara:strand:+ start:1953 stop:2276 length:324 start_codon:yes stop_codon:yes gene_type:complete
MSEKTGNTEKLEYLFNTSANLEIYLPSLKKWYRVTSLDFRSFNGKRRITEASIVKHGVVVGLPFKTIDYDGPLYAYGTNRKVKFTNEGSIIGSEILNERRNRSQKIR